MRSIFTILLAGYSCLLPAVTETNITVSMTSFNALPRGKQVLLSWTPELKGVQTYYLEKSNNGIDYKQLSEVQGSDVVTEFFETDFTPFEGVSYYRIRFKDAENSIRLSNAVPVKFNEKGEPVSPVVTHSKTANKQKLIIVRNIDGNEYYSKVEISWSENLLEAVLADPELLKGTYTIVAASDQLLYSRQFVVK
ncbi:MAG TPA: hypothetical protein VI731_08620, partial [Bacteroidia bacterium]|nr:hypothetical protein [Bacteroidia bacterium]